MKVRMRTSLNFSRYLSAFILGTAIIFPLMNQSRVITVYEAIAGIWILFLVPTYFFYRNLRKNAGKSPSLKLALVVYALGSSLYTLIEPLMAGYNLGLYMFLIPIPASVIIFVPSLFIRHRSINAKPKTEQPPDIKFTENLRKLLRGVDDNPPDVFLNPAPVRVGSNYVTYTDGKSGRISIHSEALDKFTDEEINSAVLKKYFEKKNGDALKFIYKVNFIVMFYVDALIILAAAFQFITDQNLQLAVLLTLAAVTFGFILGFQFVVRLLVYRKEAVSDLATARVLADVSGLKSYIVKSMENYQVSPFVVGKRYDRVMNFQKKLAGKRISNIESIEQIA